MTAILMIFFNVKAAVAVGKDLFYASIIKSVGIFANGKLGNINWKIVRLLAYGSIPSAIVTTIYLRYFDVASNNTVANIKFWLGIVLLLTSLSVLFRNQLAQSAKKGRWINPAFTPTLTVILGLV